MNVHILGSTVSAVDTAYFWATSQRDGNHAVSTVTSGEGLVLGGGGRNEVSFYL